jgi:hypothetical protein
VAFSALGLAGVLHHEPWRDEVEIWLVARDSESVGALLRNMGTQGHPLLWYLVSFVLTRLTHDPLAMQLTNLAIGTAAAGVFFRFAPFGLVVRLLFVLGYYALFEFTVIARSYALGLLLLFAFCARASRREGRIDAVGAVLLALLANTTLFGTMAVAALVAVEGWEAFQSRRRGRPVPLGPLVLAGVGAVLGLAHVLVQSLAIGPDHTGAYRPTYDFAWLLSGLAALGLGALPLPDLATENVWNSNAMLALPEPWYLLAPTLLGLALLVAAVLALRERPRWLAVFGLGVAPMLAIFLFVWFGWQRHHGQPFLWFVACAWLAGGLQREADAPRAAEPVLAALLALQMLAGGLLLAEDISRPFSSARAAARWLEEPARAHAVLAGTRDYAVEPIAAWTRRPIFYLDQDRFGTFMDWGHGRREVGDEEIASRAIALVLRERRRVLLVLNRAPRELELGEAIALSSDVRARYVASFVGAIVDDENYHVFEIAPPTRLRPGR